MTEQLTLPLEYKTQPDWPVWPGMDFFYTDLIVIIPAEVEGLEQPVERLH